VPVLPAVTGSAVASNDATGVPVDALQVPAAVDYKLRWS
jgi:hypothetical protein